jgi:hypothetical protein
MRRLQGLDLIRGIGIVAVVFLHSATFHFDGITEVDLSDPPLLITVIGFLLMWAGLFAIVSSTAYAYSTATRLQHGEVKPQQLLKRFWVAGGFLLTLHYIYFVVLAPKLLDVEHGNHQYALLPGLIAGGRFPPVYADRLFYSTTLSMLGWNLILIGPLLALLLRDDGLRHPRRNGAVLGGLGTLIVILSLARIPLYPLAEKAIARGNVVGALFWGFLVNKNNPILPYLGFGLFGTWLGLALAQAEQRRRLLGLFGIIGGAWLICGVVGLYLLPDTMLEREIDLFWYFITLFQLGLFLLLVVGTVSVADILQPRFLDSPSFPVRRLGMASLSIFMLETVLSQILVTIGDAAWPGWRMDIGRCLAFGALNALVWVVIVAVWARFEFRFSMEWLTVRVHAWLGRPSRKADWHGQSLSKEAHG